MQTYFMVTEKSEVEEVKEGQEEELQSLGDD